MMKKSTVIPKEHRGRYVYHLTHLKNLASILKNGLLSTNEKEQLGIKHKDIANQSIQNRRGAMEVTCFPHGRIHDYVPFYFAPRVPMLLGLLNSKNVDQQYLIYLAVKIDILEQSENIFTSAAANTSTPPIFYNDCNELRKLKWVLIDSEKWRFSDEDRRSKMAEALVYKSMRLSDIDFIVVWNERIKKEICDLLKENKLEIDTRFDEYKVLQDGQYRHKNHYFTKFWQDAQDSLTTGPHLLYLSFKEAVTDVKKFRQGKIEKPTFSDLKDAIDKIKRDFFVLPELEAIRSLETSNPEHWQNVDDHSKRVFKKLIKSNEYRTFSCSQKRSLKIAAFLHDVGKSVSRRDQFGRQIPDGDHPAAAIPMLKRILSEEFIKISAKAVRQIIMLVTYHDLLGEIIGKGRHRVQLLKPIKSMADFDLLAALTKADISSLTPSNRVRTSKHLGDFNDKLPQVKAWFKKMLLKKKNRTFLFTD